MPAEGTVREFGKVRYTLLYLKWITNKDLLYSTGKMAQYHVTAEMGKVFEKEQIHVCVQLNHFAVNLELT